MPSFADLARSVAVVGVIAVLVWFFGYPHGEDDSVHTVEISPTLHAIERIAAYDAVLPSGLSSDWRPTSARIIPPETGRKAPTSLHIGWVTPDDDYAALEESDAPATAFVRLRTDRGAVVGDEVINGQTWQRLQSSGARSLVRVDDGVAVVVTGTAEWAELAELARALT